MDSAVCEIAPDVYRISTFHPEFGIQFNQFLVKDDEPLLMHTGLKKMFPATREAVASILDPAKLRWIGFSHFESDECGALNEWLSAAPQAQAACSVVGAMVMVNDFADRPARALADGELLGIGRRRLRFLSTPHVPHCWDAGLFFDEVDQLLFCSDLFFHPGNPQPLAGDEVLGRARQSIMQNLTGPLTKGYAVYALHRCNAAPACRAKAANLGGHARFNFPGRRGGGDSESRAIDSRNARRAQIIIFRA